MLSSVVVLVLGLLVLTGGAELLVRGASRLAAARGISPLVVGLTIVAFGTSAPELSVSVASGLGGETDIALGNVVGSNIFNVLFILGAAALVTPLAVSVQLIRLDVPIMIAVSAAVLGLGFDGRISGLEGGLLVGLLVLYTAFLVRQSRRETLSQNTADSGPERRGGTAVQVGLVLGGLALLIIGSRWFVVGAVDLAERLGVGPLVIGLTIVAAGTSLPELATSVVASFRGERDIAVGNVVGSNIFNVLGVLGLTGLVAPGGLEVPASALRFDVPVMIAVAVACLPIFFTESRIARWEGALFLAYYVAYVAFLILSSTGSPLRPTVAAGLTGFVLPLTGVTLLILAGRAWRRGRPGSGSER